MYLPVLPRSPPRPNVQLEADLVTFTTGSALRGHTCTYIATAHVFCDYVPGNVVFGCLNTGLEASSETVVARDEATSRNRDERR